MVRSLTTGELLTFGLLTLALAALWLPRRNARPAAGGPRGDAPWVLLLAGAVLCGLAFGLLDWRAPLAVAGLWGLCRMLYRPGAPLRLRALAGLGVALLAGGLSLHVVPGFNNPKVIADLLLTPDAVPYSKYLNFDKALVGLLLLAFGGPLIANRSELGRLLRRAGPIAAATVGVVMVLSFVLGYVRLQPALPPFVPLWAWTNLFFTCMSEEALFRGFVQRGLQQALGDHRHAGRIALVIASLIFGIAHWAGGPRYVLLSTIAGLGYGGAVQRSGRLEAGIATHFLLNSLHYLFFTYPALASALA